MANLSAAIVMLVVWAGLMACILVRIQERGVKGFWTSSDGYAEEYPVALSVHAFFTTVINLILWPCVIFNT